ncbi:MAG: DUF4957 domain-containing protein [Bacteroides sp.]|nr:DUF4957 domain-containing protein [Bacteroides sp.]
MKKYTSTIYTLMAALCISGAAMTSCSDPDDVQDMVLGRVLSPTNISARLYQGTNIIVSWDEMSGASYYEVEAYADSPDYGERTADYTSTLTAVTDTLTDLYGETDYYIRVRAVDSSDDTRSSKWTTISRTTDLEQKMNDVYPFDYTESSISLSWVSGIEVDSITCVPTESGSSATTVNVALTSSQISASSATISGLSANTDYRATLKLNGKTRGYALFTTDEDYSTTADQVLTPSEDWVTALTSAAEGTRFALAAGTYSSTADKLEISSSIEIGAADPNDPPVINACIQLYNDAALTLYKVVLDGTDTDGSQAIEYKEAGDFGDLYIYKSEMREYTKGLIYINVAAVVDNIDIDNCDIHDITCSGGDFIDSRKGGWNNLNLTNSTIYESAASRDIFRADNASSSVSASMVTVVDQCTFYNVGNGGANYRVFYVRFTGNSNTFTNNIVANFNNKRGFANQSSTGEATFGNNYYYNCSNLMSLASGNSESPSYYDTTGTELTDDPFTDAANGDFTLTTSITSGDPRWY